MPSQPQKSTSSSSTTSSSRAIPPEQLIAFPSLSHGLHALSQAKSVDSVALHPTPLSAHHQAASEAKLRKVLSKSASSNAPLPPAFMPPSYTPPPYSSGSDSPPLMMRKPTKKISV